MKTVGDIVKSSTSKLDNLKQHTFLGKAYDK